MMSVVDTRLPGAARVEVGRKLIARTGMRQSETHIACAMNATRKLGGLSRMPLKRGSWPSDIIRRKIKEPTAYINHEVEITG